MPKIGKIFAVIFLAGVFGIAWYGWAQETIPAKDAEIATLEAKKEPPRRVDADKNKIFDDLEGIIAAQADTDTSDAIVLLNAPSDAAQLSSLKQKHGDFAEKFTYHSINGFAATFTKAQIRALAQDGDVKQIEYDAPVTPFLDASTKWFGSAKARTDFGVDGNMDGSASYSKDDVVIAVIDTGIDLNHVDLDGGKIIGWKDFATGQATPYDQVQGCDGHGTHVSSIAAGEGQGNALYKGVAPGAALVGVKVLKRQGNDCTGLMSNVNAGIQWVIDNKATYGIEIINLSLGTSGCSDGTDSTSLMVNNAVAGGIVTAVAAGNDGPKTCTIGSPAAATDAITVGAMADVDPGSSAEGLPAKGFYQAYFSSRGPTADGRTKPDLSSPGVFIHAAAAGTANGYKDLSGTSMSSPFVAGIAALMIDANPALTPAQIKSALKNTTVDWGPAGGDIDYGAGRLDGYEAVRAAGSFSGTNISIPSHQFISGNLTGTGDYDWYDINVINASYPIAVTMIMPDWVSGTNPDFDMKLYLADGVTQVAASEGTLRQETIGYQPANTGTFKLKVYSYRGSGNYFFDLSSGQTVVAISLTTDGITPFGIVPLNAARDTTATGTNDVQTVQVTTGPANLNVKSAAFSDGANTWNLGLTNGANQVKWEFATTTSAWTAFAAANTLYSMAGNVAQGSTQNLYLRLTTPTATVSFNQYSSNVTIVATAP